MARLSTRSSGESRPKTHLHTKNEDTRPVPKESVTRSKSVRTADKPASSGRSRHQRSGTVSSTSFDIFSEHDASSDTEGTSSSSRTSSDNKTSDPLKLSRVNSLLRRHQQPPRSRPTPKSEMYDHDKENDPVEEAEEAQVDAPSLSRSSSGASAQRSPVRRNASAAGRGNSRFLGYRQQSEDDDSGSDSLDDFIVSDDDEPSYHGSSDGETAEEDSPKAPTPPQPRRKLVRGRRPNPEAEIMKALVNSPQKQDLQLEPSLPSAFTLPPPQTGVTPRRLFQKNTSLSDRVNCLSLDDNDDTSLQLQRELEDDDPSSQLQKDLFLTAVEPESPLQKPKEPMQPVLETPPSSPSKKGLRSPTKERVAVPPTPFRESVDAFWSEQITNDWVDQHSPRKANKLLEEFDESDPEADMDIMPHSSRPITTTNKESRTPSKTALKKAEVAQRKAVAAAKKDFDDRKASVAEHFLQTLDDLVTDGRLQRMASATGGIRITWSKTLQTTAGRASWRRERKKSSLSSSTDATQDATAKHTAGIELAERIIDNEHRLINTIAHEYCHLANFMISNIHNNPHGESFKQWGRRCKNALHDHPVYGGGRVEVTTKHSYKIDYKYVWSCVDCSQNYGRHSKSINPARSRCGLCKGSLQQIKPKPRNVSPRKKMPALPQKLFGMELEERS
ncbi:SprT-like family-domain-containing protein [Aspergillus candidus]|uniref:SprT-like family-domain-containing protein n=1 Tax=Aspergillus candidus TaxID=41067 RepID=A0A2I2F1K4_ASPCN|nr:SprT-like family-domain-containing protein [Aspergillus candidus]PLB34522.1 SprT-like family-domain-containing protein [Aspergillus candidus]